MACKEPDYSLRCTLDAHASDVRAIACDGNHIVTASRDETAILWLPSEHNVNVYAPSFSYEGHKGYVTSVVLIPKSLLYPEGLTVTGCRDSNIRVFSRHSATPMRTLTGHSETVSSLGWKNDILLSGSWDNTARVWSNFECQLELKGHSGPVWDVANIGAGKEMAVLTASADKSIKLWKNGKEAERYTGHTDCVRGLAVKDDEHFYSCANDVTIIFWCISGEKIATFHGHTAFIYSICLIGDEGYFATGGEDRTLRIWNPAGENIQTQYLPAQSSWAVASLQNGDVVVGSSDYKSRVFTCSLDRQADEKDIMQFNESVSQSKVPLTEVGGIDKADMPDKSILLKPGKKDGQTVMVKDGDKIMCHMWSNSKMRWDSVGEVMGGAGGSAATSGKVLFNGKEYDFVFDVDIDNDTIIKLPYNRGEDTWVVAQTFIHQHQLPQAYLEQVSNFITKNAGVAATATTATSGYQDPFTGGSRYIPSGAPTGVTQSRDPFTGAGAYVPGAVGVTSKFFPQKTPLRFDNSNQSGMLAKLLLSNSSVKEPMDEVALQKMVAEVCSTVLGASSLLPLETALQWPIEHVWPALDVLRLALRFEIGHNAWLLGDKGPALIGVLTNFLQPPVNATVQLLTLRCLANMAAFPPGRQLLAAHRNIILTPVLQGCPYANKNIEISAATLVMNYSVLYLTAGTVEDKCQVLSAAATLALSVQDPEALYRVLVAMGTVLTNQDDVKDLANSLDIKSIVRNNSISPDSKLSECAKDVMRFF